MSKFKISDLGACFVIEGDDFYYADVEGSDAMISDAIGYGSPDYKECMAIAKGIKVLINKLTLLHDKNNSTAVQAAVGTSGQQNQQQGATCTSRGCLQLNSQAADIGNYPYLEKKTKPYPLRE